MPIVVGVRFHSAGKIYFFDAHALDLHVYDKVVVSTGGASSVATVVIEPREIESWPEELKKVARRADSRDFSNFEALREKEAEALALCNRYISEMRLDMLLNRVEYLLSGNKAVFYFTAEGRVDFRELVKQLASELHIKVEMRQIGVRDRAKLIGGVGVCGRMLCCQTFLNTFPGVSIKMAKEQNLSLNPEKVSGQCGRLLCCLSYENALYKEAVKGLPKMGKRCPGPHGECKVIDMNIFTRTITTVSTESRTYIQYDMDKFKAWREGTEFAPDDMIYVPPETTPTAEAAKDAVHTFEKELEERYQQNKKQNQKQDGSRKSGESQGRSRSRGRRGPRRDGQQGGQQAGQQNRPQGQQSGPAGDGKSPDRQRQTGGGPRQDKPRQSTKGRSGNKPRENQPGQGETRAKEGGGQPGGGGKSRSRGGRRRGGSGRRGPGGNRQGQPGGGQGSGNKSGGGGGGSTPPAAG